MSNKKDIAIVFDCGATNVRVIAIGIDGNILASKSFKNSTYPDPFYPEGLIWDIDKIWSDLCEASQEVISEIEIERVAGVTVTTFGVDGTLVDRPGEMLYPVISWQCKRTEKIMESIGNYIPLEKLYSISGVYPYSFNTINKFIWLKENKPELLESAYRFLFFPSLLIKKLSGVMQNDITMSGTSMMLDIEAEKISTEICDTIGIDASIFGEIAPSGAQAGTVTKEAHKQCGIQEGIPVFFGGHDTQFAIFGSGASLNQAVLNSGTWEILMARSDAFKATNDELTQCLTTEKDAQKGKFNIGQNWLASGILEWFATNFYNQYTGDELYELMIKEASLIKPGQHNLQINPAFYNDSGNDSGGVISGLTINTHRSEIYRALLESLCYRLREGLEALEVAGNFKAEKIICVGGGSKNMLWNQLRADVCNLPIEIIEQKETTVLGAAMFVFASAGLFKSPEEARDFIDYNPQIINPSKDTEVYNELYEKYINFKLP